MTPRRPAARGFVLLLFFATGLSALVYQVIWLRILATVFGSTTYATATVLAAFMGGLALGSYVFGKMADRAARPLMLYGLLEIGVGAFALVFPSLMRGYDGLHVFLQQKTSLSFYTYSLVRFVACSLILIIPTTMMGGTFPIISRYYVRNYSSFTSNVSLLYGLNTLGAFVGVVLAGFFLIEEIGILKTSWLAVSVNFCVGIAAVLMQLASSRAGAGSSARETPPDGGEIPDADPVAERLGETGRTSYGRVILLVVFLSGLASLAYEVIWTRTLIFILDSFVYSFSIMLGTFLTGIAVGSLVLSALAGKVRRGHFVLGVLFVLIGFSALATIPFFAELTAWKKAYLDSLSENVAFDAPAPWAKYVLFKFMVSSLIMAVPTLLMGAAFPLALRLYTTTLTAIGKKIGTVYASNTVGAILGSFVAGFVLIPFLGLRNALILVTGVSVFTGMLLFFTHRPWPASRRLVWCLVPAVLFAAAVFVLPTDVYQKIFQKAQKDFELVYYDEDPTATVTAHKRGERVIININGLNVAGTGFNFLTTQKMQAHLALLLHPGVERALQIGFGSGGTCYSVSLHESIRDIDCVELCEGVIKAASYFLPSNHEVLKNPKVHLTIEDARNFVMATTHRYDLILSDSVHPTYAGNGTLYSKDYFALCKKILKPGGFVSFWLPDYLLSPTDYKTIIKTFQSEFPYVMIWYVNNAIEAYTIVIGKTEPIEIDLKRLREKLEQPAVAADLAEIDVMEAKDILSYFVMGPETARRYSRDGVVNSDDHPVIEFRAPRSMSRRRTWYQNLHELAGYREPPYAYLANIGANEEEVTAFKSDFDRLYAAISLLIQGQLVNIISYEFEQEWAYYTRAAELYPDNRAVQRLEKLAASRVMVLRGETALKTGKRGEAYEFFSRAVAVNPDPYDESVGHAYYRRGYISFQQNDLRGAAREISRCLEIYPTHKNALLLNGLIALRLNDRGAAMNTCEKLRTLYPRDKEVERLKEKIDEVR